MLSPSSHRDARFRRRYLGGALILLTLAGVALAWFSFREPRIAGRPLGEWVESLGSVEQDHLRETFRTHATVQALRSSAKSPTAVADAFGAELQRSARSLTSARGWFLRKGRLWAATARVPWLAAWVSAPQPDLATERAAGARMFWGTALLVALAPSPAEGLQRFEAAVARFPEPLDKECAAGFRALTDDGHALERALVQRLEDPAADGARRALWLVCLAGLGEQAGGSADLVRVLAADPDARVRHEAIKALGRIDGRPDTAEFIQASAQDTAGIQAALLGLAQLGARARPAEGFIRRALEDREILTSMFAKIAWEALEKSSPKATTNR